MKSKTVILLLTFLIILFTTLIINGYVQTEYSKKPVVQEKVQETDIEYLYSFYISTEPNILNRPYYGQDNADLTFILYSNIRSPNSVYFMKEIFPELQQEYILPGKMKFYHKHHITSSDYEEQTEDYIIAQSLACFNTFNTQSYYDFYFKLYDTPTQDIPELAESFDISKAEFVTCVKQEPLKEIVEDYSEVENFGMIGIIPRIYIGIRSNDFTVLDGIPTYQRLQQEIKNYQIQLGD